MLRQKLLAFVTRRVRVLFEPRSRHGRANRRALQTRSHFPLHVRYVDRQHFLNDLPVYFRAKTHGFLAVHDESPFALIHLYLFKNALRAPPRLDEFQLPLS